MKATLERPAGFGTQDFDFRDPVAGPIIPDVGGGDDGEGDRGSTGGDSGGGGGGSGGGAGSGGGIGGGGGGGGSGTGGGGSGGGGGGGTGGVVLHGDPAGRVEPTDLTSLPPPWFARFRIYHPAPHGDGGTRPILHGTYPLVLFAHGLRTPGGGGQDPPDPDHGLDHRRWGGVLSLLARTGVVVASVDMEGALGPGRIDQGVARLRTVERYCYDEWEHRRVLSVTPGDWASARAHLPLGLAGHSFGAGTCAHYANLRGSVGGIASIGADWSTVGDVRPREELAAARVPTLFVAGAEDQLPSGPDGEPYLAVDPPRHAAVVQGAGHWDWFDDEGLQPHPDSYEPCRSGYGIAGELLTVFFHRYLYSRSDIPPSLLTGRRRFSIGRPRWIHDTAGRPPLDLSAPCAVRVFWRVPGRRTWPLLFPTAGQHTLGPWDSDGIHPGQWP